MIVGGGGFIPVPSQQTTLADQSASSTFVNHGAANHCDVSLITAPAPVDKGAATCTFNKLFLKFNLLNFLKFLLYGTYMIIDSLGSVLLWCCISNLM